MNYPLCAILLKPSLKLLLTPTSYSHIYLIDPINLVINGVIFFKFEHVRVDYVLHLIYIYDIKHKRDIASLGAVRLIN